MEGRIRLVARFDKNCYHFAYKTLLGCKMVRPGLGYQLRGAAFSLWMGSLACLVLTITVEKACSPVCIGGNIFDALG